MTARISYHKSHPLLILIGRWEKSDIDKQLGLVPKVELILAESALSAAKQRKKLNAGGVSAQRTLSALPMLSQKYT